MKLPHPITVVYPPLPRPDGTAVLSEPATWDSVPVVFLDSEPLGAVLAFLPYCDAIVLWSEEAYDSLGDYTRKDAEARLLEILGENLEASVQSRMRSRTGA